MKRYAYYLLIMAAAAMVACEAEPVNTSDPETPEVPELQSGTYIYTINASIPEEESKPEQIAVKSNYDASGHFSWSAGDAISVLFHNGDDNKFFTLTLTSGAGNKAASFSGEITSGYTIGASDGTVGDQKIWALFPASANHTYTAGNLPSFYVQPSVDFTTTHFSANVPMYALNTEEGALSFANLASTYKFIVTGIKAGVSKVEFSIFNQQTRGLSGLWTIEGDPSDLYINYEHASPGSANSTLTYISDVTSNQAVFYASCRYWGEFQPSITVINRANGIPIKSFVASNIIKPTSKTEIKPITLDVSEAAGGNYFVPAIAIDGDMSDWNPLTNGSLTEGINYVLVSGNSYYKELRIAYDSRYVYFYSKRNYNELLWTDDGYYYFYFDWSGDGSDELVFYVRPFVKNSVGEFASLMSANITANTRGVSSFSASCAGTYDATDIETEISISREDLSISVDDIIKLASSGNKSASKITAGSTLTF